MPQQIVTLSIPFSTLLQTVSNLDIEEKQQLWQLLEQDQDLAQIKDTRVNIPNQGTEETFSKTDRGEDLIKSQNVEEMFNKLGIR